MFNKKNGKARVKNPVNSNYVFIIISTDFEKVVCKNFTKLKNNPFYGISVEPFNYSLKNNYVIFKNEIRAANALKHFYFQQLAEKENCTFRTYCISKNKK